MDDERHNGVSGNGETEPDKHEAPPRVTHEQMHGALQHKARARARRRWGYALAATVAALAVGIIFMVQTRPGSSAPVIASAGIIQGDVRVRGPSDNEWRQLSRASGPIVAGTQLRTTLNGRVALSLPGDASLRIDAATELTLTATRAIELAAGTLYIDSGGDAAEAPFQVTTSLGVVRDIGTQFEVASFEQGLRVRVRDGAVRVEGIAGNELLASAGEQVSISTDGETGGGFFLTFDSAWAWVETLAEAPDIEGKSLILFLHWVTRETGRELRFDEPATEARARTAILRGSADNLTPMRALDVVLSTTDFDYSLRNDGAILITPRARSR